MVDFPAPFRPINPVMVPRGIANERLSSTKPGYSFFRLLTCKTFSMWLYSIFKEILFRCHSFSFSSFAFGRLKLELASVVFAAFAGTIAAVETTIMPASEIPRTLVCLFILLLTFSFCLMGCILARIM